jgi:uncharacterized protein (DUF2141 family)
MRRFLAPAALALVCCTAAAPIQAAQSSLAASLRVTVDGITGAGGTLRVGLYDEATFPAVADAALFKQQVTRASGTAAVTFDRLPPGSYAVKVLQDVNNNGKADSGEPGGISNSASPSDFDAAAIQLRPGVNVVAIHLR